MTYTDGTPGLTNTYDRVGHLEQQATPDYQVDATYNDIGQLLSESYTGGPLDGLAVTNGYDAFLRRTNLSLLDASSAIADTSYGYDGASRLQTVGSGAATATYSYLANSPLVEKIAFTNNGALRMTTSKSYDALNRLTQIASTPSTSSAVSFGYGYNNANQRTRVDLADGTHWEYNYDSLGQVISGKRYWLDGTPVAGQQFEYGFDDIGNRKSTQAGGNDSGTSLRSASYTVNRLNQYT